MVEFSPATREARVRFPASAHFYLYNYFIFNLMNLSTQPTNTLAKHDGSNFGMLPLVPFSRWKFSHGNLSSIYGFRKGLPVPGRSQPLFFIPSGNMAGNMAATSSASPSAFYECSVCHGLVMDCLLT